MKVIIIGPAFPLRGGIADFNEALAAAFHVEGIEASLFSFYYQYPSFLFPGKTQLRDGDSPAGLKIFRTISSINPFSWIKTAKKIIGEKPDLVIIRFWLPFMGPALGTIAKKLRRKKIRIIAITDNVIPHEKKPGDKLFTGYFTRQCDGFVAMSRAVLNDLSTFTTNPHRKFLPHPVYDIFGSKISKAEARNKLSFDPADKLVLFFGFIRKYKGLDLLIEAIRDERLQEMNIKVLIAGEFYEDRKPYTDLIASVNKGKNFILHSDFIPKEKVRDYFCAADIIVQPYREATQSGITQIAYHFERPMLVTNAGGLAEIVENGRVGYVTEKNPAAIAGALADFYLHGRENEFAGNVRSAKEKFEWKYFIRGVLELFHEIK